MIDNNIISRHKALYHTFGCKLNFAETSTVASQLAERGIVRVDPGETPDIIVVNTCSVTEEADKKCRQTVRSLARRYPDAAIAITGCYAQLKSDEAASLPGVVIVAGNDRKLQLPDLIEHWLTEHKPDVRIIPAKDITEFAPSCSRGDRTRYFLKVQDGCNYFCSYCTIPYARGRSRSGTIDELVAQARKVAEDGGHEIVITGVNIGDFGYGRTDNFFDLMRRLDEVKGIDRYRISSIEPNLLTDEMIEWVATSRSFMPHFHIPLQCGDDEVLRLMRRRYDSTLFAHRVETIRHFIPDAFIGVDLIVGARGETPERFEKSARFVESLPISRLHVFPYSERPGTRALTDIDIIVPQEEKHRRARRMIGISDRKLRDFCSAFEGQTRKVLVEHTIHDGSIYGFTDNYIKVKLPEGSARPNTEISVRLGKYDAETDTMSATPL